MVADVVVDHVLQFVNFEELPTDPALELVLVDDLEAKSNRHFLLQIFVNFLECFFVGFVGLSLLGFLFLQDLAVLVDELGF